MSYFITIPAKTRLNLKDILHFAGLQETELKTDENEDADMLLSTPPEPEREYLLFRPFYSSRGYKVERKGGNYNVKFDALASEEDMMMAVETAAAISRLTESLITVGSEDPVSPDHFLRAHDRTWADAHGRRSAMGLAALADFQGKMITYGYNRPVYLGPKFLKRLGYGTVPDEELHRNIMQAYMKIQEKEYDEDWFCANSFRVEEKSGIKWTYSVVTPDLNTLLPETDFFAMFNQDYKSGRVRREKFLASPIPKYEYADEVQIYLQAMNAEDSTLLLDQFGIYSPESSE